MLAQWPIRRKLQLCIALLLAIVALLAFSGLKGVYTYRELAKTISWRADELPFAEELTKLIADTRVGLSKKNDPEFSPHESHLGARAVRQEFRLNMFRVENALVRYRRHLDHELPQFGKLGDRSQDREALDAIAASLTELAQHKDDSDWLLDAGHQERVAAKVQEMYELASPLKQHLYERMHSFAGDVRGQYQTWIILSWVCAVGTVVGLIVLVRLLYVWVMAPLHVLIEGARKIAKNDDFSHRITMKTQDEIEELAEGFNAMTARFQEIRLDLDDKVKQRTQEVVRSEQMASVGFLAAGVAHEINNPLNAIAWCAESLESRLQDIIHEDGDKPDSEQNSEIAVLKKYLRRIQDEAFRCKGITDKLLDFSRLGDMEKHETNLGDLVLGVIEMVRHVGNHREKQIVFKCESYVSVLVNAQEIKQVVLNIITNSLDSLDAGGVVEVALGKLGGWAELLVTDNGCGMTPEVLKHLFEPFFTRRRDGSGTGLGLSITYRIVNDHGGSIEPSSDGAGRGSKMRVLLPLATADRNPTDRATNGREIQKRLQAAA